MARTRKPPKEQASLFDGTTEVLTGFQPSDYQRAIFDWIVNGHGDAMVRAVAGSGKTTVLEQGAHFVHVDKALFAAFNKHIALTLKTRLKGTPFHVSTIHSIGYHALASHFGTLTVQDGKYRELAGRYLEETFPAEGKLSADEFAQRQRYVSNLYLLIKFIRMTLTDPRDTPVLQQLAWQYGIVLGDLMAPGVERALEWGAQQAANDRVIDFTDMIWLPLYLKLPLSQYPWIFIDEAQDLNVCQRELVLRLRAPGGRFLFVGDPRQSIMLFAGADSHSYDRILDATDAQELPLSVCYRCPTSHLDLARLEVPEIEAKPGAPTGTITSVSEHQLPSLVQPGDLIICRLTAPLVSWCLDLIQRQIPARVRGREIGKELANLARKIGKPYGSFVARLRQHAIDQRQRLEQKHASEGAIQNSDDMCRALEVCYHGFRDCRSVDELCAAIDNLFSDDEAAIWFSTVHRAKGDEAERVFILRPDKLPLHWSGQTPDETQQERNLWYVALTRSKKVLVFLECPETVESGHAAKRLARYGAAV